MACSCYPSRTEPLSASHLLASHDDSFPFPAEMSKPIASLSDRLIFFIGSLIAILLLCSLWSYSPHLPSISRPKSPATVPDFYNDPEVQYAISTPIKNWDEKRRNWLLLHPKSANLASDRVFMITGSQPAPCKNPIGDHLLLRLFKNKVDYCRIHGCEIYYNNVLLDPKMFTFWAKYPVVRAAMIAHPEAEWIWWVDSDAAITDMDFKLPLERYKEHNLVVHGWSALVHGDRKSWVGINAGVFLLRNCQWSMELLERWASMGPASAEYSNWGGIQRSVFPDKLLPESDDQTGLLYLMVKEEERWGSKIYIESEFYFEGYWVEIVGRLRNISERYAELERKRMDLRRRHAEKASEGYGVKWEEYLKEVGYEKEGLRRPFITHFTGCQPCSGNHNQIYSGNSCWDGMQMALNFADNQVLRNFGYVHPDLLNSSLVEPFPFDFPGDGDGS